MNFRDRFLQEMALSGLPAAPIERPRCFDLQALPEPARRYLRFMRALEREPDWSFRLGFTGRFRSGLRRRWAPCETWQYNSYPEVARLFQIRIRMFGIPVLARDTYRDGHGRMLVRLADRVTLQDGTGEEFDVSEQVTYLNDAVMIAPGMLMTPEVAWFGVDAESFDIALTNGGRTVTARVFL